MATTIEVSDTSWKQLNRLKEPGQSFDDVIQQLLAVSIEPGDVEAVEADGGEDETELQLSEAGRENLPGDLNEQ